MSRSLPSRVALAGLALSLALAAAGAPARADDEPEVDGMKGAAWVDVLNKSDSARQRALAVQALLKLWVEKQYIHSLPTIGRALQVDSSVAVRTQAALALGSLRESEVEKGHGAQDLIEARGDVDLAAGRPRAGDPRQPLERLLEPLGQRGGAHPRALGHAGGHAALLGEERDGQVLDVDLGMAQALRESLRLADRFLRLLRQPVRIHALLSLPERAARSGAAALLCQLSIEVIEPRDEIDDDGGGHEADAEIPVQPAHAS